MLINILSLSTEKLIKKFGQRKIKKQRLKQKKIVNIKTYQYMPSIYAALGLRSFHEQVYTKI